MGLKDPVSLLRVFREYLQDKNGLNLTYDECIEIISSIFDKSFQNIRYFEKEKMLIQEYPYDSVNAMAEWRAYFEYRFRKAILNYCKENLSQHWLTLNISLFSFLAEQTLPVYRTHFGLPDRRVLEENEGKSKRSKRESGFTNLSKYQQKYSTVWEIVKNNISSIFYFDKTPESEKDLVIYEIDPDVSPGVGTVDAKFIGKTCINGNHLIDSNWRKEIKNTEYVKEPWLLYQNERERNVEERNYQWSILRFFIRVGIFNPSYAVYSVHAGVPEFKDILLKVWNQKEKKVIREIDGIKKDALVSYKQLNDILTEQCASSKKETRKPYLDTEGQWQNFDHADKYSPKENDELDLILDLINEFEPNLLNYRVALFEAGFFFLTEDDNTIAHIYWMPIVINWRNQWTAGAAFFNSDKRIGAEKIWERNEHGYFPDGSKEPSTPITPEDKVPQVLITTLYFLSGLFADKLIGSIEESLRPSIERAAAVSIMSRNISHNIGSHVLSYQKHIFSDEQTMLHAGVLHDLVLPENEGFFLNPKKVAAEKNYQLYLTPNQTEHEEELFSLPYLRSLGQLLGYFQERQDYISTFASERYLYFSSLYFYQNILRFFSGKPTDKTRNIALDHIILSEGYSQKEIEIKAYRCTQEGKKIPLSSAEDIQVSLPSGNTGRQGIFTILENFIRNSAKHGQPKSLREGKNLQIEIVLSDYSEVLYRLELRDNSANTDEQVIEDIQKILNSPLVKKDGKLDERHKGIKEIQIAAAWLRGIHPHQLSEKDYQDGKVISVSKTKGEGCLQYTFYLSKPRNGLLLVKDLALFYKNGEKAMGLKSEFEVSLKYWDIEELPLSESLVTYPLNQDKRPYHFVVAHTSLSEDENWAVYSPKIRAYCPVRFLKGIDAQALKSPNLSEDLYQKWVERDVFKIVAASSKWEELRIEISDPKRFKKPNFYRIESMITNPEVAAPTRILFREHSDLSNQFDEFVKENNNNITQFCYIEGISGGNTTGRLLREETKDRYWYYKMLETALTKIVIMDERIWRDNLGRDKKERERNFLRWSKKNIHIFSLEYDETDPNKLLMKDLKNDTVAILNQNGSAQFEVGYKSLYQESHFISMHQGLMERAVKHCSESVGYKQLNEQKRVENLFVNFRENFMQAKFRVLIHSGRSKAHIMPKDTAFVQLSSLGSALRDAKYSLCDLFYSTLQENDSDL